MCVFYSYKNYSRNSLNTYTKETKKIISNYEAISIEMNSNICSAVPLEDPYFAVGGTDLYIFKKTYKEKKEENQIDSDLVIEEHSFDGYDEFKIEEEKESQAINKNMIINNTSPENTYVKYHVHTVTMEDTIENICSKYGVNINTLKKYNTFDNLELNMKLLIPENEES